MAAGCTVLAHPWLPGVHNRPALFVKKPDMRPQFHFTGLRAIKDTVYEILKQKAPASEHAGRSFQFCLSDICRRCSWVTNRWPVFLLYNIFIEGKMRGTGTDVLFSVKNPVGAVAVSFIDKQPLVAGFAAGFARTVPG